MDHMAWLADKQTTGGGDYGVKLPTVSAMAWDSYVVFYKASRCLMMHQVLEAALEDLLVLLLPPQTPAQGQAAQRQEQACDWLGVVKLMQHRTNDEVVASPARAQDQIHKMAPLLAPAQADSHSQAADTCERLLKELSEANRAIFHRSPALRDKVRAACPAQETPCHLPLTKLPEHGC